MSDNAPIAPKAIFENAIGRAALALDPFTEADPVGVHATMLGAISAYLGRDVTVRTGNRTMPLSVWTVLVGVTGRGRKGTATTLGLRVIREAFKSWAHSGIEKSLPATGLGFAELLHGHGNDEDGVAPLFIVEEEMDLQITNGRKDARLGGFLRYAWDGATFRHKTSKTDLAIKNPHVAVMGHVQPINWGTIAGSRDATGGTYNRYLPLWVEKSKSLSVFAPPPGEEDVIDEEASKLRSAASFARDVSEVKVKPDVAELFESYHRPLADSLTEGNDALAQMSERAMAYLIRIAAIYALMDRRDHIEIEDFDSALALVTYSVETVQYVLPEVGGESLASKIRRALVAAGEDGLKKSELWDIVGRRYSKLDLAQAIASLPQVTIKRGPSTGGRPPEMLVWSETTRQRVGV